VDDLVELPVGRAVPASPGKSSMMPVQDSSAPPIMTDQKMSFCPALNLLGGRMDALLQQAAALLDPLQSTGWGCCAHPEHEDQDQRRHERPGQVVVRDLAPGRQRAEGPSPISGSSRAAEDQVQPGQRQDDEGRGQQPVREAFER
jgi:hypothetical protein